jgi:hypothetical protein
VNRKVREQAFRAALRAQAERGSAALMDPTGWETPSTKRAAEYLRQAPDGLAVRPLLLVVEDLDSVEARSFRNLEGVSVLEAAELQTVDIVAARAILVERSGWDRLAGGPSEVEAVEPKPKPKPKPKAKPKPKPKPAPKAAPPPAEEDEPAAEAAEAPEAAAVAEPAPAEAPEEAAAEEQPAAEEEPAAEEAPAPKPRRSRAAKPKPEPEAEADAPAETAEEDGS